MRALVLVLAALSILVCATLVTLTTVLDRTTNAASINVESVRIAEEAQIDLLLHERAVAPLLQRDLAASLRQRLARAQQFVTSVEEAEVLAEANAKLDGYLAAAGQAGLPRAEVEAHHAAAYIALDALVEANVADARQAQQTAQIWNRRANAVGLVVAALLLLVVTLTLTWLEHRAFLPISDLAHAMGRFARNERDARAPERGPAELREISRRFNEMASAISAQRGLQVAFLGGVAHDLRNPLSVLKMGVALAPPDAPLPPEPKLRKALQSMDVQITRLERMVCDFLDITRIEAGALELRTARHDVRRIVEQVVLWFDAMAPARAIEVSMPDQPVEVECDSLRVEQVLTNLISNAIKYSEAGSSVEVAIAEHDGEVSIRVTDHGIGIAQHELDQVFQPFRRAGLSQQGVPGVGLGLYVVKRIVEAHEGRIEVDSEPGRGSTFRVFLPRGGGATVRDDVETRPAPRLVG